ncbi:putative ribonuclease H-like domain-containing protein [Tanacetum coccineum]
MRPFGCPFTIRNTLDYLGKFDGKADKRFFVGYFVNSKAFRVFNSRTRIVEETLHINFLENKPNVAGSGPEWLFDIDTLTKSMNYKLVVARNQMNGNAGTKESIDAGQAGKKTVPNDKVADDVKKKTTEDPPKEDDKDDQDLREFERLIVQWKEAEININSTNCVSAVSSPVNIVGTKDVDVNSTNSIYTTCPLVNFDWLSYINTNPPDDPKMPNLENIGIFSGDYDDEYFVAGGDMNNLESSMHVSPIATTRVHKDHLVEQIIRDLHSAPQIRRMTKNSEEHDPSWREEMQDELLQFKLQKMDVKSSFLYGNIEEEVYVCQPLGFEDPDLPDRRGTIDKTLFIKKVKGDILLVQIYVDDIIFGSTKKELCTEFEKLMHKKFQMSSMGELTFFLGLIASTPMETSKPLLKDAEAEDVDVHLYRSMIGSLMYLTASRPDIMFVVCACVRFQVTPKVSHLHVVKRIFRYLKGQPKLGLWYPKDSPFDLEAYFDSDYAGASLDMNSTTGEYVAAANCYGQVLWIQNQMIDYGYNFMNTKIFIDNERTICIVENPVFHSKTKHIEIRHHFIRDSYEKRLIQVIKIHTGHNVADLLTKALDVSHFQFLTASIGMLNL